MRRRGSMNGNHEACSGTGPCLPLPDNVIAAIKIGGEKQMSIQDKEAIVSQYLSDMLGGRRAPIRLMSARVEDHGTAVAVTVEGAEALERARRKRLAESDDKVGNQVVADLASRSRADAVRRAENSQRYGRP